MQVQKITKEPTVMDGHQTSHHQSSEYSFEDRIRTVNFFCALLELLSTLTSTSKISASIDTNKIHHNIQPISFFQH